MTEQKRTVNEESTNLKEDFLKNNFMAKMSHELRSPLNSIIGFAELMYHGKVGPLSDEHKEYLGDILASSRHLLLIINDVLDLAKIESGRMEFNPEFIDLNKIFQETATLFKHLIASKDIHFETSSDPALDHILIDPTRLKQIIYNYVSNALKCTPHGGRVHLRARPYDQFNFVLEVEDNGIGIKEENLNHLFVEFKQLDREVAEKYPSSGLGLALTKHIVDSQGGKVGVKSEFGKGSVFFAILPKTSIKKHDSKKKFE